MALLRRFFVAVGVVSFILCIYVLVLNRQWPPSASLMPHGYRQDVTRRTNSSSEEPKQPPGRRDDPHQQPDLLSASPTKKPLPGHNVQTPAATEPHVHGKVRANVSTSPPGSDQVKKANESNRVLPTKPIGPTDPQYIGDSYMSDGVSLHTLCPDGVRARVQSSAFGSRFLERIPVLQTLKHATPEQYQRLRRYPGTHGWGGVDFKTLVETLSVLNTSANREMLDDWQRRGAASSCRRCAVVGNGGILKGSKKGKEIDHHHYIFRTNGAITKGFEEDVGSRTTHYTFSTNTLMNSMRSYARFGYSRPPVSEETRYVFLPDHDRDYLLAKAAATHTLVERGPERKQDPRKYFGEDVSAEKLKIYHPDFVRYLRNRSEAAPALQDCFQHTDWQVFREAALHEGEVDLEDYASGVLGYIRKCTDDVTSTRTVTDYPNQKPEMHNAPRTPLYQTHSTFFYSRFEDSKPPPAPDSPSHLANSLSA